MSSSFVVGSRYVELRSAADGPSGPEQALATLSFPVFLSLSCPLDWISIIGTSEKEKKKKCLGDTKLRVYTFPREIRGPAPCRKHNSGFSYRSPARL